MWTRVYKCACAYGGTRSTSQSFFKDFSFWDSISLFCNQKQWAWISVHVELNTWKTGERLITCSRQGECGIHFRCGTLASPTKQAWGFYSQSLGAVPFWTCSFSTFLSMLIAPSSFSWKQRRGRFEGAISTGICPWKSPCCLVADTSWPVSPRDPPPVSASPGLE